MTDVELAQIAALKECKFSPGSSAKSFVHRLAGYAGVKAEDIADPIVADATRKFTSARELSEKETAFLDKLAHQYRKQIGHCMSVACLACHAPVLTESEVAVALDSFIEDRTDAVGVKYAVQIPVWRKHALAIYNKQHGKTFAHSYEYATKVAANNRRAETRGDIYCRFCGERLFAQVKQPHRLVAESADAQRHLTICALQTLAGMRAAAKPGHRALPMEQMWDDGPLFGGGA